MTTHWNRQTLTGRIVSMSRTHWTIPWFGKTLKVPKARDPREHPGYRHVYQSRGGAVDVFLTAQGLVDFRYISATRHRLAEAVQNCADPIVLRQIAALLGVVEAPVVEGSR
jgi:hypothetical protein